MVSPTLPFRNVAAVIGVLVVCRLVVRQLCGALSGVRAFFLAPLGLGCSSINLKKYGPWAGEILDIALQERIDLLSLLFQS